MFQYEDFWIVTLKNSYFGEVETPYTCIVGDLFNLYRVCWYTILRLIYLLKFSSMKIHHANRALFAQQIVRCYDYTWLLDEKHIDYKISDI